MWRDGVAQVVVLSSKPVLACGLARVIDGSEQLAGQPADFDEQPECWLLRADVVLIEVEDPVMVEAFVGKLRDLRPNIQVVLLTSDAAPWCEPLCMATKALGWLTAHTTPEDLLHALEAAATLGRIPSSPICRGERPLARSAERAMVEALTSRERQVLGLLAGGRTPEEISVLLAVSRNTVRTHLQNLMVKVGARSRLEAVVVARRAGHVITRAQAGEMA
jgi:two-component system NarL family response regulator